MGNEEESLEGPVDYAEHSRLVGVPNPPSPKLSSGTFSCAPPDLRPLQPSPAWERHGQPAGGPDLKLGSRSPSSALLLSNLASFGRSDSWASHAHAGAPSPSPGPSGTSVVSSGGSGSLPLDPRSARPLLLQSLLLTSEFVQTP